MAENPFAKWVTEAPIEPPVSPAEAAAGGQPVNPFTRFAPESTPRLTDAPTRITVRPADAPYKDQGPPQEPMGMGTAAGVGAVQGATLNFGDEFIGLLNAGLEATPNRLKGLQARTPVVGGPASIAIGAMRLGWEMLNGEDGPATQAYRQARNRFRDAAEQAQAEQPVASPVGQVAGALAAPVGVAAAPVRAGASLLANLGARSLRGAATGATVGGLSGVGEGTDLTERATKGAVGTAVGGAIGGTVPAAVEGGVRLGRLMGSRARSLVRPTSEAERRYAAAKAADEAADPAAAARLTEAEALAARAEGVPVAAMDTGGENVRALGRSAANMSPDARATLQRTLDPRFEAQGTRAMDKLERMMTYAPDARRRTIQEVNEQVYEPRYAKAWKDSAGTKLWDEDLELLVQAPEVQRAIRTAMVNARNWAVRDGLTPPNGAFVIEGGRTTVKPTKSGHYLPSLQLWDYVKRALDRSGDPPSQDLARTLREHLDTLVPSYKAAREAAQPAKYFDGAANAFEAGRNFVNRGQHFQEKSRAMLDRMDPRERSLFRDGYLQQMFEIIEKRPDRLDVVKRINDSPAARKEAEAALGSVGYRELDAFVHVETVMQFMREAVKGNSTTARQIIEYGLTGVGGGYGVFTGDPHALGAAAFVAGRRAVNARMARKVAELLVADDPAAFRKGIALLARDERMLSNLHIVGGKLGSKVAPPQTTNAIGP